MKKLLLTLGTIATISASTVAVVSCGTTPDTKPGVTPTKNGENSEDSKEVNRVLADEAGKFTDSEPTSESFMRVGGTSDFHVFGDGKIRLVKAGGVDWNKVFAEFRPGDYIDFVFKDASDIASFSERVLFDNTLADKNISAGTEISSIYFNKFIVKNGEVVGMPEETGIFQSEGVAGDKSIYGLKAVKKNVIRMTFKDFFEKDNQHLDAQIIYLRGFTDENGDGVVDLKDEQMTSPFAIDRTIMYTNYWDPYNTVKKQYWHKDWTVGVHQPEIVDYINKL